MQDSQFSSIANRPHPGPLPEGEGELATLLLLTLPLNLLTSAFVVIDCPLVGLYATNIRSTVMAERQCPGCKSKDIAVLPISERSAHQMGVGYANSPLGVFINVAKVVAGYTVYPWLKCRTCGKEWRQFESPV